MSEKDRQNRTDRALILAAFIVFFISTLLMFKDDLAFENPLSADSRLMGQVLQGTGDIRWKRYDRIQWANAEQNTNLFMKDQLFVGKDSKLEIVLDGVKIKLQQNTLISIRKVKDTLDLQILYGKVTLDKPPATKKIAIRNQHNQTVWKSEEAQNLKTVDISNDSVMYKTDNVAQLEKIYWVSTPTVAEPLMDLVPEPPAPVPPPPPPVLHGLKMAQLEEPRYDIEKIEKRKDLIAQNTKLPEEEAKNVLAMEEVVKPSPYKIFPKWVVSPFVFFRDAVVDTPLAVLSSTSSSKLSGGIYLMHHRSFMNKTLTIPFMWAPLVANVNNKTTVLHLTRTGFDITHPGSFVNYSTGMRFNYENYLTATGTARKPVVAIGTDMSLPLRFGVSKQFVFDTVKATGALSWCPTYSITASTTNFVCMASSLNSYYMSKYGFNVGANAFATYYHMDFGKSVKEKVTELGVGFGAEF